MRGGLVSRGLTIQACWVDASSMAAFVQERKPKKPKSVLQQVSNCFHEHAFDFRRDVGGGRFRFVAALFVGDRSADVPRSVIPIRRHGHKSAGALSLGCQLVLDE